MKETKKYSVPSKEELRQKLTPEQYACTQEGCTERPFANPYWDNKKDGLYVDVVSGEPLFSSLDKYDSGSGWPSFTQPVAENIQYKKDSKFGMVRTEIVSKHGESHLGHVFDDGPQPTGQRYCLNSASLRFIPLEDMKREGYGQFLFPFAEKKHWEIATLAGGCFWGMEDLLRKLPGVLVTQVGYTGGKTKNAVYTEVKTGKTGHAEAMQILFDPALISYEKILLEFFRMHNPTTVDRQGNDVGSQYRSAIFFANEAQRKTAEEVKAKVERSQKWGAPVVTQIVPATEFWRAEDGHQDYLEKYPDGYTCHYRRDFDFDS